MSVFHFSYFLNTQFDDLQQIAMQIDIQSIKPKVIRVETIYKRQIV